MSKKRSLVGFSWAKLVGTAILTLPVTAVAGILSADLSVTKTDGAMTATPGGQVTYTITASNDGPSAVSDASVTDTFPPALTNCSWTCTPEAMSGSMCTAGPFMGNIADTGVTIEIMSFVTYTANCDIAPDATGSLDNTATVASAATMDPNNADNSATDSDTLVPSADLSITKTDNADPVNAGGTVTYTITVNNDGPSDATNVVVTDTLPAGLTLISTSGCAEDPNGAPTCTLGTIAAGNLAQFTLTANVGGAVSGNVINNASVASDATDPNILNDSTTESTVVNAVADLGITKTDGVTSVNAGGSLTYTIVASNNGPSADPSVSVTDAFPAGLTCTHTSVAAGGATGNTNGSGDLAETLSMPAGSTVTYTVNCGVASNLTGALSNTATIGGSVTDTNAGNNSATDSDTVINIVADLSITKDDGVTEIAAGDSLTYTIVVTNNGPAQVSDANVVDNFNAPLQGCSWTSVAAGGASGNSNGSGAVLDEVLDLPVGASVTYTVVCNTSPVFQGAAALSNTATVSSALAAESNGGDNTATDTDTITGEIHPVPALSPWALALLALGMVSMVAFRRRRNGRR